MTESVLIFGAGSPDGLGGALARKFASEGQHVIVTGRTLEKVQASADLASEDGGSCEALAVDVTREEEVGAAFDLLEQRGHCVAAIIYNAGSNAIIPFEELSASQFESFWRIGCYGAFLVAKRAMPLLAAQGQGSLLFTGASASTRGKANFAHFASAKAGLRNLVQSLAREYGPQGVHVAHVIVDGVINGEILRTRFPQYLEQVGPEGSLEPAAIADAFWYLHNQPRSAWTHELDLRPFKENW